MFHFLLRYIIIQFSHYGLGLSKSFMEGGTKNWFLKATYFIILLTYMSIAFFPHLIRYFRGAYIENITKGRICLLKRFVIGYREKQMLQCILTRIIIKYFIFNFLLKMSYQ